MEAAALPVRRALRSSAAAAVGKFLGRYGLIILLLLLPLFCGGRDGADGEGLSHIIENLKDGVSNGAIWALVAIGYTLVYGIIELINFAHGEVFMLGSFISASFFTTIGLHEGSSAVVLFFGILLTLVIAML